MTPPEVQAEALNLLTLYGAIHRNRGAMVRRALAAGITRTEIHRRSGISREAINRYAGCPGRPGRPPRAAGTSETTPKEG